MVPTLVQCCVCHLWKFFHRASCASTLPKGPGLHQVLAGVGHFTEQAQEAGTGCNQGNGVEFRLWACFATSLKLPI